MLGGLAGTLGCPIQRGHLALAQVDISQSLAMGRTQAGKKPGTSHTHIYTPETRAHTHTHTAHVSTVHGQVYTSSNTCTPSQIHACIHVDSGRQTHVQHMSVGQSGNVGGIP